MGSMGSMTMTAYIYSKQLNKLLPLFSNGVEMIFDDQESAMATAVKVAGEWNNVNYLEVNDWEPKCE